MNKTSKQEETEDLRHLVYFLASVYQENFNKFRPEPDMPKWKEKAFMSFSTIQGSGNRNNIEKLSKQKYSQERVKRAVEQLKNKP